MIESKEKEDRERRKASFLVRVWQEAPGIEGGEPVLRGYLRDLSSGEEQYLSDPTDLGDVILRRLSFGTRRQASSEEDKSAAMNRGSKK